MNDLASRLLNAVDKERIKATLFGMVKVASPTGAVRPFATHFAGVLGEIGLSDVHFVETSGWPDSPSVVGWRRGNAGGPTLHFNGHMDHIDQEHVAPYLDGDKVVGRGAADMKFGLASMVELVRVLNDAAVTLPGDLLLSGHDLHEAPIGRSQGVRTLIESGYVGDAAIVTEGPKDQVYIANKSNCVFEIDIGWDGQAMHELTVPAGTPNLVEIGAEVIVALKALKAQVAQRLDTQVGPESMFLGISQAGDFYNRLPTSCHIVGTRRFPPEVRRSDVMQELLETARAATAAWPVTVSINASQGNDGFRISPDDPLVKMLQAAYGEIHGKELTTGVQLFGADNAKFINWGKIPAVGYGINLTKAHADLEWADANELVDVVRVLLMTTLKFYGMA